MIESLKDKPRVYAVLIRAIVAGESNKTTLLEELKDYFNIVNSNTANILLEYYRGNYAIKNKEGAIVPFIPLYNLS